MSTALAFIRALGNTARAGVNVVAVAQAQQQSGRGRKRKRKVADDCTSCAAWEMVDRQKESVRGGSL